MGIISLLTLIFLTIAVAGMAVTIYYLWGADVLWQATAAYRRGDIDEGDRLRAKAHRWVKL